MYTQYKAYYVSSNLLYWASNITKYCRNLDIKVCKYNIEMDVDSM